MNVLKESQEIAFQEILAFQRKDSNWRFKRSQNKQLGKRSEKKSCQTWQT